MTARTLDWSSEPAPLTAEAVASCVGELAAPALRHSAPLARIEIPRRIVPYVRIPHAAKHSKPAKRYHASQNMLAMELRAGLRAAGIFGRIEQRIRVGVEVYVTPCASGPNKGGFRANEGDWDNYYKAVVDCMKHHGLIEEDNMARVAGPGPGSGAYLDVRERVVVTVWAADAVGLRMEG